MQNFRSMGGKLWISVKTVNNDHLKRILDPKHTANMFLQQVRTHMQNFRSNGRKLWISVKTRYTVGAVRGTDLFSFPRYSAQFVLSEKSSFSYYCTI